MRDDISILDDLQRGGYGRVHRRRASADAVSATSPASLSLPLSSSPRLSRSPGRRGRRNGKDGGRGSVGKEKERENERATRRRKAIVKQCGHRSILSPS